MSTTITKEKIFQNIIASSERLNRQSRATAKKKTASSAKTLSPEEEAAAIIQQFQQLLSQQQQSNNADNKEASSSSSSPGEIIANIRDGCGDSYFSRALDLHNRVLAKAILDFQGKEVTANQKYKDGSNIFHRLAKHPYAGRTIENHNFLLESLIDGNDVDAEVKRLMLLTARDTYGRNILHFAFSEVRDGGEYIVVHQEEQQDDKQDENKKKTSTKKRTIIDFPCKPYLQMLLDTTPKELLEERTRGGETPLCFAAAHLGFNCRPHSAEGALQMIVEASLAYDKSLLELPQTDRMVLNAPAQSGATPFLALCNNMHAAEEGIQVLLDAGADPGVVDSGNSNGLYCLVYDNGVVSHDVEACVEMLLLDKRCDPSVKSAETNRSAVLECCSTAIGPVADLLIAARPAAVLEEYDLSPSYWSEAGKSRSSRRSESSPSSSSSPDSDSYSDTIARKNLVKGDPRPVNAFHRALATLLKLSHTDSQPFGERQNTLQQPSRVLAAIQKNLAPHDDLRKRAQEELLTKSGLVRVVIPTTTSSSSSMVHEGRTSSTSLTQTVHWVDATPFELLSMAFDVPPPLPSQKKNDDDDGGGDDSAGMKKAFTQVVENAAERDLFGLGWCRRERRTCLEELLKMGLQFPTSNDANAFFSEKILPYEKWCANVERHALVARKLLTKTDALEKTAEGDDDDAFVEKKEPWLKFVRDILLSAVTTAAEDANENDNGTEKKSTRRTRTADETAKAAQSLIAEFENQQLRAKLAAEEAERNAAREKAANDRFWGDVRLGIAAVVAGVGVWWKWFS